MSILYLKQTKVAQFPMVSLQAHLAKLVRLYSVKDNAVLRSNGLSLSCSKLGLLSDSIDGSLGPVVAAGNANGRVGKASNVIFLVGSSSAVLGSAAESSRLLLFSRVKSAAGRLVI